MASSEWDPEKYAEFAEMRAKPFWDLVDMIETSQPIRTMVDLGCGSGELTVALALRLDVEHTAGIDSSPAMLGRTRSTAAVSFRQGDISSWSSHEPVDLIVANASLQWVPNHRGVVARWVDSLADDGQIAIQVPANADHPSHICSATIAEREPFRSAMGGTPPPDPVATNVLAVDSYAELLYDLGVSDPHVRLQVYPQVMTSSAAVVDWVSGTSLTRFFRLLPDELHQDLLDAYRTELVTTIGDRSPYLYAFKRILMHGRLGARSQPSSSLSN